MQKELRVFRKSRDQALRERQWAIEKLKQAENQTRKLNSELASAKTTTQLIQNRLKNTIYRCDVLDGIIAKQRNHLLSNNVPLPPVS